MVVPTGGNDTVLPLLGCGPTDWWAFADAVDDAPLLLAVDCAVADDASAAGPDDPLLAGAEPEPAAEVEVGVEVEPPHAAISRTNDPIPVAAAHPHLRISLSNSQG